MFVFAHIGCHQPDHYAGSRDPNYQPTKFQLVNTPLDGGRRTGEVIQ